MIVVFNVLIFSFLKFLLNRKNELFALILACLVWLLSQEIKLACSLIYF